MEGGWGVEWVEGLVVVCDGRAVGGWWWVGGVGGCGVEEGVWEEGEEWD
jgi:hypothetical protein